MVKPKIIVIGLDGASWRLLDPWIKKGKLPNLKEIMENGVHGKLKSVIPATTCPAWKCYSTGKKPANLGAFGWSLINWEEETFETLRFSLTEETEIWDHLNREGLTAGVINTPITYPPKKLDGFMISGPSTPSENKDYTHPKSLKKKLKEEYDYRIFPKITFWLEEVLEKEEIFEYIEEDIKTKFEVARDLAEGVDFLHLTIYRTDAMQHGLWDDEIVERLWELIDEKIGKIKEEYPNSNILIMSDHGMEKIDTYFNIGRWLQKQGYCSTEEGGEGRSLLGRLGIGRKRIFNLVEKFNLNWLSKLILETIPYEVARETAKMVRTSGSTPNPDWEESEVIPSGKLLYLNPSNENKEDLKKTLRKQIKEIGAPETGEYIIREVYEKEEVFQGEYSEIAPDLAIVPEDNVCVKSHLGKEMWGESLTRWIASHIPDGVFLAYGPDFEDSVEVENARLIDLAPIILYTFGLSPTGDMDGRVLKKIFKDIDSGKRQPASGEIKPSSEKEKIKNEISKLKNNEKI